MDNPGKAETTTMNYRLLTLPSTMTARRRVATTLAQEILDNSETKDFLIASEYELCRRFDISRVTVRLALSDLEHRGLIYRKHGKGTFAHGQSTRVHRNLAVLLKSPPTDKRALAEIIQGAHDVVSSLHSALMLISVSPKEWRSELASTLAGVIVIPNGITKEDLENLKNRNLPFLLLGETHLPGPRIILEEATGFYNQPWFDRLKSTSTSSETNFLNCGKLAAETLNRAFLTGQPVTEIAIPPLIFPSRQQHGAIATL